MMSQKHFIVSLLLLLLNTSTVGVRNDQLAVAAYLDFLLFAGVEDLKDVLRNFVFGGLALTRLEQQLDIAQFAKVEITLLLESGILQLHFVYLLLKGSVVACAGSHRLPHLAYWLSRGLSVTLTSVPLVRLVLLLLTALLLGCRHFATSSDVKQLLVLASGGAIVGLSVVVLLEECLDPLTELEVVLVLGFAELGHINMALDSILIEGSLQYLVVLHKLVLMFGVPLHSAVGEGARIQTVHDTAVGRSCRALLDLRDTQLLRGLIDANNLPQATR